MSGDLVERLSAPFPPATVSWRVGATNGDKTKGMALAYIDARAVQDRLNEVCGHEWQVKHHYCGGEKLACEIGIKIDGEWLWRGDGAGQSDVEAEKGAFSDSFKRAAVRWGIGRYLYDIDSPWVSIEQKGKSYIISAREMGGLLSILTGKTQSNVAPPAGGPQRYSGPADGKHPKWDYAAARFREIEKALKEAKVAKLAVDIWSVNQRDLDLIEEVGLPYDRLEALRDRVLAKLGPPLDAHDSAPALMGEP